VQEVLSYIRQYSRLSPKPGGVTDGSAFAADGRKLSFKGKCHYCGRVGHMQRHCQKKRRDEQSGQRSDEKGPAAAHVCKSSDMRNVALAAPGSNEDGVMLYVCCCTHHLVNDRCFLSEMRPSDVKCMRMGGNYAHRVEGQGSAVLVGGPLGRVALQNVLYVPTMIHNLFSRGHALTSGAKEEADGKGFIIRRQNDNAVILTGSTGGLSVFHQRLKVLNPSVSCITSASKKCSSEWDEGQVQGKAFVAYGATRLCLAGEQLVHVITARARDVAASDTVTDISQLRVFGCSSSLSTPKSKHGVKLNPASASGVFVGYIPHTKGWRVAIGNTVHVSPCVAFHEDMDGDCSVVPSEYFTDSNSEDEYDEDVATGLPLPPRAAPAGPAPVDQVPNVIAEIEPAAAYVYQTADAPPELGVTKEAALRRSERVRAMPHR
jgi:hypothetical protein